jgi:DNA-binding CsgD family transcriptional regulator
VRARQAVQLIAAAYDLDGSNEEWFERVGARLAATVGSEAAPYGYRFSMTPEGHLTFHDAHVPGDHGDSVGAVTQLHQQLSPAEALLFFRPGTMYGTFTENLERMPDTHDGRAAREFFERHGGGEEATAIGVIDASRQGILVAALAPTIELTEGDRLTQRRLGVHVAAGMRLRLALADRDPLDASEAVFETDGRVAHATGEAEGLREELRERVQRLDRSRAKADEETLGVWEGLVEGRWSLIDCFDSDGRRYYVAIANPALVVPSRALSSLEAQVVAMAVAGEPNKLIAYALGVAESTVAVALSNAMLKLGAKTRVDLIRLGQAALASG